MLKPADIPNAICILRMLIVVPTLAALAGERYGLALTLVFIAGFSDALDGFLAKRFDWRSRLGGLLDPLADKFLLVSLFLALALLGLLPAWLAAVTVGRDIVIVAGGLAYNYLVGPVQPEPSGASKLNTAAQLACVVSVLFQKSFDWRIEPLITAVGAAVFVTSVVSGLDYVIRWSIRALQARA